MINNQVKIKMQISTKTKNQKNHTIKSTQKQKIQEAKTVQSIDDENEYVIIQSTPKDKKKEKWLQPQKTPQEKQTPQEKELPAQNITFYDPDEEQIKKSYAKTAQHERGSPPEFNPQTNTYTYAIIRNQQEKQSALLNYALTLKPSQNEEEMLKYHESEEEY